MVPACQCRCQRAPSAVLVVREETKYEGADPVVFADRPQQFDDADKLALDEGFFMSASGSTSSSKIGRLSSGLERI